MFQVQTSSLLHRVRRLAADPEDPLVTDRDLLRRFTLQRDEAAFATLVRRHGPMVLETGRRVLHDRHDAEDVLQATFLVLARKAGSLAWHASVGPWLHAVAYRLARKARVGAARRRARLEPLQDCPAPEQPQDPGWQAVLDEELTRLPQKVRAPLVLCYLEGATRDEAAQQLACPLGTLKGRLERGRALLRQRLKRRGVTLSAGLLAAALTQRAASSTARLVSLAVRGIPIDPGRPEAAGVSPGAAARARHALRGMMMSRLKLTAAVLLVLAALVAGAGLLARQTLAPQAVVTADGKPLSSPPTTEARTDRYGDPLPDEAVARLGTLRFRHGSYIQSLAFQAGGKRLIATGGDGVRLWDVATGKQLRQICAATDGLGPTALAPNGKFFVVADGNSAGAIAVRDAATGKLVRRFGKRTVNRVRLSLDGKVLAAVCFPAVIELWDPATGAALHALEGHKDQIWSAVFSADGKTLVSAGDDRTIRFWDVATGKEVRQIDCGEMVRQVAVSADGGLVASIGHVKSVKPGMSVWHPGNQVRVREAAGGKELHVLTMPAKEVFGGARVGFLHLCFAPAGKTLLTGGLDGKLRVWDAATGKETSRFGGFSGTPSAFAFSPDGKTLALADGGSCIRLIDLASGKDRLALHGHRTSVNAIAIAPDGRTVVTAGWDGVLRFWDPGTGRLLRRRADPLGDFSIPELLPGGKHYLGVGADKVLRLRELDTGKEVRAFRWQASGHGFALSPDGRTFAEAVPDAEDIRLRDAATGKVLHTLRGARPFAGGFTFAPDSRTLFAWREDRTVTVWDVTTGQKRRQFPGPAAPSSGGPQPYFTVRLSPDGKFLAFCLQQPVLPILDAATGKEFRRFRIARDGVSALAFSPDGKTVAWGGWHEGTVYLGELATSRERHHFTGHRGRVLALAFSADGRTLVSGTDDTTALVWDLTGRLAGEAGKGRLSSRALAAHWTALADTDAAAAFRALRALAADPARSVPFLAERLRPVAGAEEKRLRRLVADLESDQFAAREKARVELEKLGEAALGVLRAALAAKPSLDMRRRLEQLIDKQESEDWSPSPERLRTLRALESLERAGTPGARRVLEALARGAPGARVTREARASQERLSRQPVPKP